MKKVRALLTGFLFFSIAIFKAQSVSKADSLIRVLAVAKEDSNRALMLLDLATRLKFKKTDTALILARQGKNLSVSLDHALGEARANVVLGDVLAAKKQFEQSIDKYKEAILIYQKLDRKKELAAAIANMAICYYDKGDFAIALENDYKALKMYEEIKYEAGQATVLGNIGIIHLFNKKLDKALEYSKRALEIDKKLNNAAGIGRHLGNIATVYQHQATILKQTDTAAANEKYRKALQAYAESMEIAIKTSDGIQQARVLDNQGNVYFEMGDTANCFKFYKEAYVIDKANGNKEGMAMHLGNIGWIYFESNRFSEAESYTKQAVDLLEGSEHAFLISNFNENLSEIYEKLGKYDLALEKYRTAIRFRDSLFNIDNAKRQLETEMNFEFEKKEAIAKEESARQTLIRNVLIAGFGLMFVLVIVVFRGYRTKKKANEIISLQKSEVEKQKLIVEHKNKEITDSIQYAKRIQKSLMPNEKYIERTLKGERKNGSS
jgi:tetratricopeptide (TPR) repeat protein